MKQWTTLDKSDWGEGPWQGEPDKITWYDDATDLACLMVRNPRTGNWCGYVGVEPDHKLYKARYQECDFDVHGGLSFSGLCDPDATEDDGICHIPDPGRTHDVWWFGFDCHHGYDYAPLYAMRCQTLDNWSKSLAEYLTYRDMSYVQDQVKHLADQLGKIKPTVIPIRWEDINMLYVFAVIGGATFLVSVWSMVWPHKK
jgi:hypothetical protein